MSTATTLASASFAGGKLLVRGPYNPDMQEFYRSLPTSKWDAAENCWRCTATPGAAWRLKHAPIHFSLDAETAALAEKIDGRDIGDRQPRIRNGKDWGHQLTAYNFALSLPTGALLALAMGCGKSRVAVNLVQNRGAKSVLVACPKSVLPVWRREFAKHCAVPHEVLVLDKDQTVAKKAAAAILHMASCRARGLLAVVVCNYESLWRPAMLKFAAERDWDAVIADESHRIRDSQTATAKGMYEIGRRAAYRLCLTGTPMPNSPMNLFGQFKFLDVGIFGSSYHWFRSRYAISGHFGADHIVGWKNQDELAERMAALTYQAGKDVLTDLPPELHETVPVTLGAECRNIYDKLEAEAIAHVGDGTVTAANALVKLLRLSQITGGVAKTEDGEERIVDDAKSLAVEELLAGMDAPAVVFCRFKADLDRVLEIGKRLNKKTGELSGRRKDLTDMGTMPEGLDLLAVQVQAGGVGVDLTRARYGIYWNHPWSLGDYDQSLNRIHRPGQTQPVTYYHLIATDTVDVAVWDALEKKREVIAIVIAYLKGAKG